MTFPVLFVVQEMQEVVRSGQKSRTQAMNFKQAEIGD